jgi:RNA polymerase sigma-70 factor (ECF subfamily)
VRDGRSPIFADLISPGPDDQNDEFERFHRDGHWAEPVATWDQLDPERIVAGRELWAHVWKALENLPAAQRAVVVMRDVEDTELPEIGRLLGLSPANVRVLLHRGRHRLRKAVQALLDGTPAGAASRNHAKDRNAGGTRKSDPHRRHVLFDWPRRILELAR